MAKRVYDYIEIYLGSPHPSDLTFGKTSVEKLVEQQNRRLKRLNADFRLKTYASSTVSLDRLLTLPVADELEFRQRPVCLLVLDDRYRSKHQREMFVARTHHIPKQSQYPVHCVLPQKELREKRLKKWLGEMEKLFNVRLVIPTETGFKAFVDSLFTFRELSGRPLSQYFSSSKAPSASTAM